MQGANDPVDRVRRQRELVAAVEMHQYEVRQPRIRFCSGRQPLGTLEKQVERVWS